MFTRKKIAASCLVTVVGLVLVALLVACGGSASRGSARPEASDATKAATAKVPGSPSVLKGEHVEDVCYQFVKAGFVQIEPREDADLRIAVLHDEGDVSKVTIEGDSSFHKDDEYPKDARVVVEYHTYRKKDKRSISTDDLKRSIEKWVNEAQAGSEGRGPAAGSESEGAKSANADPSTGAAAENAIVLEANVSGEYGRSITTYGGGSEYDTATRLGWFVPEGTYVVRNIGVSGVSEQVNYGSTEPAVNDSGFMESTQFESVLISPGETADIHVPAGGCIYITGNNGKLELVKR